MRKITSSCLIIHENEEIAAVYEVGESKADIKKALKDSGVFESFTRAAWKQLAEESVVGCISDLAQVLIDDGYWSDVDNIEIELVDLRNI